MRLRSDHELSGENLTVNLYALLADAAADLSELNPDRLPTPQALFNRFIAWAG